MPLGWIFDCEFAVILVGQFDSPFVRRIAVALNHFEVPFERQVLSVFQDFQEMLEINPLAKVPVLILDDGERLYDSRAIFEFLERRVPANRRLTPRDEAAFLRALRVEAMGIGLAEKTYERSIEFSRRRPGYRDPSWTARLERQIVSTLMWLEERADTAWLAGTSLSRADLAVAVATTYLSEKVPKFFTPMQYPQLERHRQACEALPAFADAAYSVSEAMATGWQPEADQ